MKSEYWIALWILIAMVTLAYILGPKSDDWSMVYEATQTPEVEGGPNRLVLFNEDGLTRMECAALFYEHLRRLNNNGAVIEYEIWCDNLNTKGRGTNFQRQMYWYET